MTKFPETMQALAFKKTGGVEELEKMTVPFPEHKAGAIIVKVRYMSVIEFQPRYNAHIGLLDWCQLYRYILQEGTVSHREVPANQWTRGFRHHRRLTDRQSYAE